MSRQAAPGQPQNAIAPPPVNPASSPSHSQSSGKVHSRLREKWNPLASIYADSWWRRWWPQIGAVLLSIGCLLANVGILYSIDGKPLAVHYIFHISITPNTLISIFSTLSSFSMMFAVGDCLGQLKWTYFMQQPHRLKDLQTFDEASRGPMGSIVFLFKLNDKAFIASVGALITIAALANDPFTQALLHYPSELVPQSNGTALILRTQQYLGSDSPQARAGPLDLINGFMSGLYTQSLQIEYTCDTGHCTWGPFQSLAFCSQCTDITDQLHTNCSLQDIYLENGGATLDCNWTTPLGSIMAQNFTVAFGIVDDNYLEPSYSILGAGLFTGNPDVNIGDHGQLASGEFLQFNGYYNFTLDRGNLSAIPLPRGTSCSLAFCMKTYYSEFIAGKLQDTVINETALLFQNDPAYSLTIYNDALLAGVVGDSYPDNFDAYAAYYSGQSEVFWVNGASLLGFMGVLASTLSFSTNLDGTSDQSNPTGTALNGFNHGNISANFVKLATGISDAIRSAPGNVQVTGQAFGTQVFVQVRWPWLSFAASIVLLTAIFVAFSVVFSLEKGESIWKSSSLALLFHGLKGWTEQELDIQSMDEMEEKANEMHAVLERDDVGRMVFVRSDI